VNLKRRRALPALLVKLVEHRLDSPGRVLPPETLLSVGWPGERLHFTSGIGRVRTAIWTLRKLGLEQRLITCADGYLLDPAQAVVWSAGVATNSIA
jgi:hypothetical protein